MKTRRIFSILLTLAMALGMLALMPVTASAASTLTAGNAAELTAALSSAASGDTIKLTADITYDTWINIGQAITFDLNGFTLNATAGLRVWGKVLLADHTNGEFNVSSTSRSFCIDTYGNDPKIEVTNVTTATAEYAVYGNAGEIIVYGDVKQEKAGAAAADCGV